MGLKLCLLSVLLTILPSCCAETIDITLPPSPATNFEYTLDINPKNREYNCIDANNNNNNNTDIFWRDIKLEKLPNPLNIYSAYRSSKELGINTFQCQNGATYLGAISVNIQEGGHVTASIYGIPTTYSGNQVLSVLEDTENVVLTCSADTGEWQLPSGGVSQSFPVLTLAKVSPQDNNTVYTCKRIIGGDTLLEISVTLSVEPGVGGTGTEGSESSSLSSSQTPVLCSTPIGTGIMPPAFHSAVPASSTQPTSSAVAPPPPPTLVTTLLTTSDSTNRTLTSTSRPAYPLGPVPIAIISLCIVCCVCLAACILGLVLVASCCSRVCNPRERNQAPEDRTGGYHELPTYEQMETLGLEVRRSDRIKSDLLCLLADDGKQLEIQFHSIPLRTQQPSNIASHPDNVTKNRYPDLVPYDCNRVVLGDGSYVNASYIPLDTKANGFIATQAPLSEGVGDFWRLIGDSQVSCVVQLANAVENGRRRCERYWPEAGTGGVNVSGVELELSEETEYGDWCRREISVTGNGNRSVTQFHFTEWSSGTFPQDTSGFIRMLRGVKKFHDQQRPICVVCADGVGRSGVFILLFSALCLLESGATVSLTDLLAAMRQNRAGMVRSVDQFRYCWLCLQELAFGDTSVPLSQFHSFCQESASSDGIRFSEEFQQLAFVTKHCLRGQITDALLPENVPKNSVPSSLPFDGNRVPLRSHAWHGGDYINASYFQLGDVRNRFIGTLNPTSRTLRAFLQLLWETRPDRVVMLETPIGYDRIVSGVSSDSCYWPEEGLQLQWDNFTVVSLTSERSGGLITQRLSLSNQMESGTHEFSHLILVDWQVTGVPINPTSVMALAGECVASTAPLVVHCRDCVGMSGVFLVSCGAMWQMRQEGKVDLFSLVKRARCERQNIICTQEQYSACYEVAERAVRGSEYQNLSPTMHEVSAISNPIPL